IQDLLAVNPGHARAIRHVLKNRLRKRVRPLEHHADSFAQFHYVDFRAENIVAIKQQLPFDTSPVDQVVHPVDAPQKRALAAPRGPDGGGQKMLGDRKRHIREGVLAPIVKIKVLDRHLGRSPRQFGSSTWGSFTGKGVWTSHKRVFYWGLLHNLRL